MIRRHFLFSIGSLFPLTKGWAADSQALKLENRTPRGSLYTVCQINLGVFDLDLFHSDGSGKPLRTFAALEKFAGSKQRKVILAMNAGMYEIDGSPVGWCVGGGVTAGGLNQSAGEGNFFLKPNGVFAVQDGKAMVLETSKAKKVLSRASLITQSGPMLVIEGKFHPAFREDSPNRKVRNGVGVTPEGVVWLVISEVPVTFHGMASLFRDDLGCPDALFLDGVVSQLHAPSLGKHGNGAPLGPLLAVTEPI